MKKEKKRRKERSKQTNKKSHHHSDKSVHYYCVCFIWGMLAHPSGAKVALWDQLGPWQRDQLALKNTDIFSFGDDSYQCHRKEQKRHSTPPLIHSFCSQMSMSNSYHLITISETDLIRTNLQQVLLLMTKITFLAHSSPVCNTCAPDSLCKKAGDYVTYPREQTDRELQRLKIKASGPIRLTPGRRQAPVSPITSRFLSRSHHVFL